jgi:hypothetical protein
MQQTLDTNRQLPLASAPTWAWNSGRPLPGADCFSRHISDLKMRTEMVLETLAFSSLNHLTRLVWLLSSNLYCPCEAACVRCS